MRGKRAKRERKWLRRLNPHACYEDTNPRDVHPGRRYGGPAVNKFKRPASFRITTLEGQAVSKKNRDEASVVLRAAIAKRERRKERNLSC